MNKERYKLAKQIKELVCQYCKTYEGKEEKGLVVAAFHEMCDDTHWIENSELLTVALEDDRINEMFDKIDPPWFGGNEGDRRIRKMRERQRNEANNKHNKMCWKRRRRHRI